MNGHTLGPWRSSSTRLKIQDCQMSHQIWSAAPRPTPDESPIDIEGARIAGCRVAFIEEQNVGVDAADANARLIAAAPDYHRTAVEMCERHDKDARAANFEHCGCVDCAPFRPIIARAGGRS